MPHRVVRGAVAALALVALLALVAPLSAGAAVRASAAVRGSAAALPLKPGRYAGSVSMAPVYPSPTAKVALKMTGQWAVSVDGHDHIRGYETLTAVDPLSQPAGCTTNIISFALILKASLGIGGDPGTNGRPGYVSGSWVYIDLDSLTKGQGWYAVPGTYTLTCGNLPPGSGTINLAGEASDPFWGYTMRMPLALFRTVGRSYGVRVGDTNNDFFTQIYTLVSHP